MVTTSSSCFSGGAAAMSSSVGDARAAGAREEKEQAAISRARAYFAIWIFILNGVCLFSTVPLDLLDTNIMITIPNHPKILFYSVVSNPRQHAGEDRRPDVVMWRFLTP